MDFSNEITNARRVFLYGAGIVAYGVREALDELCGKKTTAHIVTDTHPAGDDFAGFPVYGIDSPELAKMCGEEDLVVVAVPAEYHADIKNTLKEKSYRCIILDDEMIYSLMGKYLKGKFRFRLTEDLPNGKKDSDVKIYRAVSSRDKKIKSDRGKNDRTYDVQGGVVLDDMRMPNIFHDDDGENISSRNRDYSELTVTYWVWKNVRADYLGICHYRRFLNLSDNDYLRLAANDADVVLPLPYLCHGDASFQYTRYVSDEDFSLLCSVLNKKEKAAFLSAMAKPYLYNHNLLIAKQNVFSDYCRFMFDILGRVEEKERNKPARNDRHMGYLGELLTSAYFTNRADRLKIIHAREVWLA